MIKVRFKKGIKVKQESQDPPFTGFSLFMEERCAVRSREYSRPANHTLVLSGHKAAERRPA